MKTAVIFQGGGPLGAFAAGAWQVVAPWLRDEGHELVGIAGASIGALNAAVVATHARKDDLGAAALARLWRRDIATPSLPGAFSAFSALPGELQAWQGWWTGLALGNPALFTPLYANWHPLAGLRRVGLPMYSQQRMRSLLGALVGEGYASDARSTPLLAVAATDVLQGSLRVFSSDEQPVSAAVLSASAAIPLMFEPVEVDGRLYCDGEVNRESPLPALVRALERSGRCHPGEPLQLVTIGQFSPVPDRLPLTTQEIIDRALHLLLAGKLADEAVPAARRIDITRGPLPHEGISGQFDYSAARIHALLDSGRARAQQALDAQAGPPGEAARVVPMRAP